MTARGVAHRACIVVREYPETAFWITTCATLAAAVEGNLYVLVPLVAAQSVVINHVVRRMWAPPIMITISPISGRAMIPRQPHSPAAERHRHARHR